MRPLEISTDHSADFEFIHHALMWLSEYEEVQVRCSYEAHYPFRNPELIDEAIRCFVNEEGVTALRSVHVMSESAYKTFEISEVVNYKALGL